jgi:hypothetical protein
MPRDGTLLFLGMHPSAILELWIAVAERIRCARGAINLLTHCETRFSGRPAMLESYRRFLTYLAAHGGYRFVLPLEYAAKCGSTT